MIMVFTSGHVYERKQLFRRSWAGRQHGGLLRVSFVSLCILKNVFVEWLCIFVFGQQVKIFMKESVRDTVGSPNVSGYITFKKCTFFYFENYYDFENRFCDFATDFVILCVIFCFSSDFAIDFQTISWVISWFLSDFVIFKIKWWFLAHPTESVWAQDRSGILFACLHGLRLPILFPIKNRNVASYSKGRIPLES